jgi:surface antigen
LLAAGFVAMSLTLAVLSAAPLASAAAGGNSLSAGQSLQAGQDLVSTGGQYKLVMQTDGNLVSYGNGCVIWASNTGGTGSNNRLVMQTDGNLVIYTSGGKPVWASHTAGTGSSNTLYMQGDGNSVVYNSGGKPLWASGRSNADHLCTSGTLQAGQYLYSGNEQYKLVMQGDGNLVVYTRSGSPIWASNTAGTGSTNRLVVQTDGNVVVYTSGGKAVWASGTNGTGNGNRLVIQSNGNLVIYISRGTAIWTALTSGQWAGTNGPVAASKYYGYSYPNAPQCTTGAHKCVLDKWSFYQGQCTSWVAYRLNDLNGIAFNDTYRGQTWGDASHWATAAKNLNIAVNGTPALGSVAWYSNDHVAYVEKVNSSTSVVISEMNYDFGNGFWVHTITTSSGWPTAFIHIADR